MESPQKQVFDISMMSLVKVALVAAVAAIIYFVKDIVALVFLAVIIASAVEGWVGFFEKRRIPRIAGVFFAYVAFIGLLLLALYAIVPPIVEEIQQLIVVVPDYYDAVSKQIFHTTRGISPDYARSTQEFFAGFERRLSGVGSGAFATIADVFGGIVDFGIVIVISFYLAVQRKGVENFLRLVTPKENEGYVLDLWRRVDVKLGRWLQGQLLLGLIVGFSVFFGLSLIGVPYAMLLGLVAAIFEIVPIVGPLFSALLGIAVAALASSFLAVITVIFYVILQQIENHVLVPLFMKRIIGLNPVIVIVALLAGAQLGGILGMIIAVPLAAIAVEALDDLAKRKALAREE